MTGLILLDLQKSFDTIDRDILLKKLSAIGFSNHTNGWFKSNLSNQLLRVNLENCYLDPSIIIFGVPQGSILGPLLFLIYVNDMPQAVKSNLFLYADNSSLVFQGKDVIEIEKKKANILQTSVNGLQIIDLAFILVKIRLNLYFLL